MAETRWYTQQLVPGPEPDLLIRFQDDRSDGQLPDGGVVGFFVMARRGGGWHRDDSYISMFEDGGVLQVSDAEGRRFEQAWLPEGASAA